MFFTFFFFSGFVKLAQCLTQVRVKKVNENKLTRVRKTSNLKSNKLVYLLMKYMNDK